MIPPDEFRDFVGFARTLLFVVMILAASAAIGLIYLVEYVKEQPVTRNKDMIFGALVAVVCAFGFVGLWLASIVPNQQVKPW